MSYIANALLWTRPEQWIIWIMYDWFLVLYREVLLVHNTINLISYKFLLKQF